MILFLGMKKRMVPCRYIYSDMQLITDCRLQKLEAAYRKSRKKKSAAGEKSKEAVIEKNMDTEQDVAGKKGKTRADHQTQKRYVFIHLYMNISDH